MHIEKVKGWIEKHGLSWRIIEPRRSTRTVREAAEALGVDTSSIVKTLIVVGEKGVYAVIIPGDRRLSINKNKLERIVGDHVRLAKPGEVVKYTGYPVGGVPPVGLPENVKLVVDELLLAKEVVYGGGGSDKLLLEFKPRELIEIVRPIVADVSV